MIRIPKAAKHIYKKYGATSVLDPTSGWGGRMLGAWGRRYARYWAFSGAMLQDSLADVVAVEPITLPRMGRREGGTVGSVEESLKWGWCLRAGVVGAEPGALLEDGLDIVPCLLVNQALMLASVACALVDGLADVGAVVQHPVSLV